MLLVLPIVTGCGFGPPSIGAVRGKVLFSGKPLANVRVEFYPEQETGDRYLVSRATTAADGTYELICDDDRKGAVLGWHRVVVRTIRDGSSENPREADPQNPSPRTKKPKLNLTPYQRLESTRERREVVAGENTIELDLVP